jgi:hypothetical protein
MADTNEHKRMTHGSDDQTSSGEVFLNANDPDDKTAADASARTADLMV